MTMNQLGKPFVIVALLSCVFVFAAGSARAQAPRWPAPKLNDSNYQKWFKFVWPTKEELKWRNIRWHTELEDAAKEARKLQRPILLWAMNGHPCGST